MAATTARKRRAAYEDLLKVPDHSPSTEPLDRVLKLPAYARAGVAHAWLVNAEARTLEVFRREGERWLLVAAHGGDALVRAEPFDAEELDLLALWGEMRPGSDHG